MLEKNHYKSIANVFPIPAIDLCLVNNKGEILMAKRTNTPGKNFYFVPGGRIHKGDSQISCIRKIISEEGLQNVTPYASRFQLAGVWDHYYDDGPLESKSASHYVVSMYYLLIESIEGEDIELYTRLNSKYIEEYITPNCQHEKGTWKWAGKESDLKIHKYAQRYFDYIKNTHTKKRGAI